MDRSIIVIAILIIASLMLCGCVSSKQVVSKDDIKTEDKELASTTVPTPTTIPTPITTQILKTDDDIKFELLYKTDYQTYIPAMKKSMEAAHNVDVATATMIENELESGYWINYYGAAGRLKNLGSFYQPQVDTLTTAEDDAMVAIRFFARAAEYQEMGDDVAALDRLLEAITYKESAEKGFNSIQLLKN